MDLLLEVFCAVCSHSTSITIYWLSATKDIKIIKTNTFDDKKTKCTTKNSFRRISIFCFSEVVVLHQLVHLYTPDINTSHLQLHLSPYERIQLR